MNINKLLLLLMIAWLVACNEQEKPVSTNHPKREISVIKKEVYQGDTNAYKELKIIYMDYAPEDFLYTALFMANEYEYPPAYFDVFYKLVCANVGNVNYISEMNPKLKKIAVEYLKIAAEKGDEQARQVLADCKECK